MAPIVLTLTAAYIVGSIPFSYLVARLFGVRDVREVGSGNVGATNVMRSAGRTAGLLALILDAAKGAAAALGAARLFPGSTLPPVAALVAMLGHMYPVWLGFRGGKGVATGVGAFLPLAPLATGAGVCAFACVVFATRFVSLGSCAGAVAVAAVAFATVPSASVASCAGAAAALICWRHRGNLERIVKGTERRVGSAKG